MKFLSMWRLHSGGKEEVTSLTLLTQNGLDDHVHEIIPFEHPFNSEVPWYKDYEFMIWGINTTGTHRNVFPSSNYLWKAYNNYHTMSSPPAPSWHCCLQATSLISQLPSQILISYIHLDAELIDTSTVMATFLFSTGALFTRETVCRR